MPIKGMYRVSAWLWIKGGVWLSNPVDLSKYNLLPSIPIPIKFQPIRELKSVPAGGLGGAAEKRDFLLRDYFNLSLFCLHKLAFWSFPPYNKYKE